MANKIQIKRGSGSSVLSYGELGFNKDSNLLYIGREDGQNQVIGGEHVLGGRNLLSCLPLSSLPFAKDASGAGTLGELSYDSGSNSLHIINTNSNIRFWLWDNHPVLAGETYTVSCWVASAEIDSERGEEYQFQISLSSETETIDWIDKNDETLRYFSQPDPAKTGWVWKVIHQTFTVPTGAIKTSIAFRTGFDYETYTNNFFVKNFKIERSHTYTDWSPAPEDIVLRGIPTTANLTVQKSDPYLYLYNTDTNQKLGLHWYKNTESTNTFGIYDQANSKHLMSIKQDGTVTLYKALPVTSGGTGATTAEEARNALSAAHIDNGIVRVLNLGGIGTNTSESNYWKLWNINDGNNNYPVWLMPSQNGTQGLGYSNYRIKEVWANNYPCGTWNGDVIAVTKGGTGATTATAARTNLGITPTNIGALALSGGTMTGMLQIPSDNLRILNRNNFDTTDGGHILFQTGTADGNRDVVLGTHGGGLRGYTYVNGEYQHLFNVGDNGVFTANNFYTTGTATASYGRFTSGTDAVPDSNAAVALRLGSETGQHLDIDNNKILSKTDAATMGDLYLQGMQIQHSGSIISGTWNASTIGVGYGGTGATSADGARTNLGAAAAWVEGFTPPGARNKTLTDLLRISLDSQTWNDYDYPCWVGTEGGTLSSCPVSGVFYAYREVRKISAHQIMVTLTESYPRPGRVWTRTYDKNYQTWLPQEGWACNETIHYGTNAPTGILKGSIWLKPI